MKNKAIPTVSTASTTDFEPNRVTALHQQIEVERTALEELAHEDASQVLQTIFDSLDVLQHRLQGAERLAKLFGEVTAESVQNASSTPQGASGSEAPTTYTVQSAQGQKAGTRSTL